MPHLVDATLFFSPTSGGVRRYLLTKHAWLNRERRLRHTLFVPGPRNAGKPGGIVEFRSLRLRAGYRCPFNLPGLRDALARLDPDLIEAGDPYHMAWQATVVADRLGIPAVAFCHSDLVGLAGARLGTAGRRLAARYLRALYSRFELVFAPSQVVAARLCDAGIGPLVVQPLGVDAGIFHPGRRDPLLRARLGLDPSTRLLVFAGRLAPEKDVPALIEVAERLGAPYHLLLVGGSVCARLSRRVTLVRYERDAARVAACLAGADVLVHAGRHETFGLVALEAMACGLPVVAFEGGALAEIVDRSVGALAQSTGGSAALAAAVVDVFARDPRALGAAARARVLATYSWDAALARQLHHYERLLGVRAPAHLAAAAT